MYNIEIITYATHDQGKFQELIYNPFDIKITVLGWGTKWNGFIDKFKRMYKYIQTLDDDKIIIFVDGFDTYVNQDLHTIYNRFKEFNSDIVVSEQDNVFSGQFYLQKKVFGTCKNNMIANSGLYMGYNKPIQQLLKYILETNYSSDDQTNLNEACSHFHNIKIDVNRRLFHNQNYYERYFRNDTDSCFVSTPGDLSWNRMKRVPSEYGPFIWKELLVFVFAIVIVYIFVKKIKK
jgi:hypothetical protein